MTSSVASEWLDSNRHRSYPMDTYGWRRVVSPESGLDCVILDAMVFDPSASGGDELVVSGISVSESSTRVSMEYCGIGFDVVLSESAESEGTGSFDVRAMHIDTPGGGKASAYFVFSRHSSIVDVVGLGEWKIGCRVIGSRVASLNDGVGVDGVRVSGSEGVDGHAEEAVASGSVVLEDGFRTSPVVRDGKVVVRVGTRFGLDPCKFDLDVGGSNDCRRPLMFFCGQNATNSGNVDLKGGPGISVLSGGTYTINDVSSKCDGKTVPCVEIVAGNKLLEMCAAE